MVLNALLDLNDPYFDDLGECVHHDAATCWNDFLSSFESSHSISVLSCFTIIKDKLICLIYALLLETTFFLELCSKLRGPSLTNVMLTQYKLSH